MPVLFLPPGFAFQSLPDPELSYTFLRRWHPVGVQTWLHNLKSRQKHPQKLTQLSPRSYPRHLVGKGTAQKETIIDIISDSQVNRKFPYRRSTDSQTFNNYFYLFGYLCTTRITINNNTPHLKSPMNQNKTAAFGRPAMKLLGASTSLRSTNTRP